jgi:hypothetical protein
LVTVAEGILDGMQRIANSLEDRLERFCGLRWLGQTLDLD